MRLALKKTPRPTLMGPVSHAIGRRLDKSAYSHAELVFSDCMSASAAIGEGFRFKAINYTSNAWDFYTLPDELEPDARMWAELHEGEPYDYFYMLRFMGLPLLSESEGSWGCVEAIGAMLGWIEPWRYGPGGLLARCKQQYGSRQVLRPW